WHSWDHLIQEFDNTKPNYGLVADHPELFNLNFDKGNASADWQHFNSVAYNEDLDQIALCSPAWNEVYIIDHSTTTLEAASHTGGNSGHGGDILWRWGNPEMYGAGDSTDQQLFFQHDAHWIPSGYRHENKIILYNNGKNRIPDEYSTVDIVAPSILPNGDYEMDGSGSYFPAIPDYIYTAPVPTDFYSRIISSADMLPNGNIIIDEGTQGHYFEIDSLDNTVWDYVNPVVQGAILEQEEIIPGNGTLENSTFRVRRIAEDFPGIVVLPLVNQGPIELNPYVSTCEVGLDDLENLQLLVYPSPSHDELFVEFSEKNATYAIQNNTGQVILKGSLSSKAINIKHLSEGMYYISVIDGGFYYTTKFIKE
ncbi:MAG: aryl-sulfate sulfotransferase, partial [Crocinitomicaceae bacterium]|nr:aryl-sulfate sulfotransferase [Crocinitomicaceae bacterium]